MTTAGDVVVRVEAGPGVGLGHLRRCLTLMRQLREDGFRVRLICADRFDSAIERLVGDIEVLWLGDTAEYRGSGRYPDTEASDAEATLSMIGRASGESSWVVVDHYGLGEQWERLIREGGYRVLAVDDFRHRRHCADILVGDSDAPFDAALNSGPDESRTLVGRAFALVDREFESSDLLPSRAGGAKRLLVSYGGGDPTDETTKALEAILLLRHDERCREWVGQVDVVVGQANTRRNELCRRAQRLDDVTVHVAPSSLAPLMRRIDVALTAGGNTMIEALALKKPCVVTLTGDNQRLMIDQLLARGVIVSPGHHATVSAADVAAAVCTCLADYDRIGDDLKARPLFDHSGARRISAAVQSMSGARR